MFARVIGRAFERAGGSTWQLELEAGCKQARALLSAHPEWLPLLTRVTVPSSVLPLYEHLLDLTAADGMSPVDTMFVASSALSFTLGTVLVERMMNRPAQSGSPGRAAPRGERLAPQHGGEMVAAPCLDRSGLR
jgi:hypothetical protein